MNKRYCSLLLIPLLSLTACNKSISQVDAESLLKNMVNPKVEGEYPYWTIEFSRTEKGGGDSPIIKQTLIYDQSREGNVHSRYHEETIYQQGERHIIDSEGISITSYQDYGRVIYAQCITDGEFKAASAYGSYLVDVGGLPINTKGGYWSFVPSTFQEAYFNYEIDIHESSYDKEQDYHTVYDNKFSSKGDGNLSVKMNGYGYYGNNSDDHHFESNITFNYDRHYLRSLSKHICRYQKYGTEKILFLETTAEVAFKYYKEFTFELPSDWKDYLV